MAWRISEYLGGIMVGRRQLIAILGGLLIVGFAATSLTAYYVAHRTISAQVTETTLPLTSDTIYSDIQQDLLRPIFISSLMAQDTFLRDWTLEEQQLAWEEQVCISYRYHNS